MATLNLKSVSFTFIGSVLGSALMYWGDPDDHRYIHSILPENMKGIVAQVLCCMIEMYVILQQVYLYFFEFLIGFLFAFGGTCALHKDKLPPTGKLAVPGSWGYSKAFLKVHASIETYKQLEILAAQFNQIFRLSVLNTTGRFIMVHTFTIYVVVRHHHEFPTAVVVMDSSWIVMFVLSEVIYYFFCGSLYENSQKLLRKWGRFLARRDRRVSKRRTIGVRLAGYVKRNTALFIILIIFRGSRGCLIAF